MRSISRTIAAVVCVCVAAGCGFTYPPPAAPDIVNKEAFNPMAPVALIKMAGDGGTIVGLVHGWPFPHVEPSEGMPGGLFTYVGKFKVTARSATDSHPVSAIGKRTDYFRESTRVAFAQPLSFELGQKAAIDDISMTFSYMESGRKIAVRMSSRQVSANAFTYQGHTIQPPPERTDSELIAGDYADEYGGYLLYEIRQ